MCRDLNKSPNLSSPEKANYTRALLSYQSLAVLAPIMPGAVVFAFRCPQAQHRDRTESLSPAIAKQGLQYLNQPKFTEIPVELFPRTGILSSQF